VPPVQSFTPAFDPSFNSLQLLTSQKRRAARRQTTPQRRTSHFPALSPTAKKHKTIESERAREVVHQSLGLLRDEYESRITGMSAFPPSILSSHIRTSVARYQEEFSAATDRAVCCSCGKLVRLTDYQISSEDPLLQTLAGTLDDCGRHGSFCDLCSLCHAALARGTIPKFSARNLVNVSLCQHYPQELEDLTLLEEYLIAKCHPVGWSSCQTTAGRSRVSHQLPGAARPFYRHPPGSWAAAPDSAES
jgi:hypothetical protein